MDFRLCYVRYSNLSSIIRRVAMVEIKKNYSNNPISIQFVTLPAPLRKLRMIKLNFGIFSLCEQHFFRAVIIYDIHSMHTMLLPPPLLSHRIGFKFRFRFYQSGVWMAMARVQFSKFAHFQNIII